MNSTGGSSGEESADLSFGAGDLEAGFDVLMFKNRKRFVFFEH